MKFAAGKKNFVLPQLFHHFEKKKNLSLNNGKSFCICVTKKSCFLLCKPLMKIWNRKFHFSTKLCEKFTATLYIILSPINKRKLWQYFVHFVFSDKFGHVGNYVAFLSGWKILFSFSSPYLFCLHNTLYTTVVVKLNTWGYGIRVCTLL